MRIDTTNGYLLNLRDFSLHDAPITKIQYDVFKNTLSVFAKTYQKPFKDIKITYFDVIGLEGITCDIWSAMLDSLNILGLDYMEPSDRYLIKKIFQERSKGIEDQARLTLPENYIETVLTGMSGNSLRVACEYLEIELEP